MTCLDVFRFVSRWLVWTCLGFFGGLFGLVRTCLELFSVACADLLGPVIRWLFWTCLDLCVFGGCFGPDWSCLDMFFAGLFGPV